MFFVLDENNNKVEAFDKEGVIAAIEKAIADGSLADLVADAAFVSKLKCCVGGDTFGMAFVTQAKYNELYSNGTTKANTLYFITDDTTAETMNEMLTNISNAVTDVENKSNKIAEELEEETYKREELANQTRKVLEARQDIGNVSFCTYEHGTTYSYSITPPESNTQTNPIGVAGTISIETDSNKIYPVSFSTLWNLHNGNRAEVSLVVAEQTLGDEQGEIVMATFFVDLSNITRAISIQPKAFYNISNRAYEDIWKITINSLSIYY